MIQLSLINEVNCLNIEICAGNIRLKRNSFGTAIGGELVDFG